MWPPISPMVVMDRNNLNERKKGTVMYRDIRLQAKLLAELRRYSPPTSRCWALCAIARPSSLYDIRHQHGSATSPNILLSFSNHSATRYDNPITFYIYLFVFSPVSPLYCIYLSSSSVSDISTWTHLFVYSSSTSAM
jgi:hypothetical protein